MQNETLCINSVVSLWVGQAGVKMNAVQELMTSNASPRQTREGRGPPGKGGQPGKNRESPFLNPSQKSESFFSWAGVRFCRMYRVSRKIVNHFFKNRESLIIFS